MRGGIEGRSPVTALVKPLAEMQRAQACDVASREELRLAPIRIIGAADLSQANDRLHGKLALKL